MSATLSTIDGILKDFYIGPINDQLNNEAFIMEARQRRTRKWMGRQAVIPVHIGRNSGVGPASEAPGTLPAAGRQTHKQLLVDSKYYYGRFQLSGPSIASAESAGAGAFASAMDEEMTRLVEDLMQRLNKDFIFGNATKGFLHERKVSALATAPQVDAGASLTGGAASDWAYDGDFEVFAGVQPGNTSTWIRVKLIRLDTYDEVEEVAGPTNLNIFVSDFDELAGTIELTVGADNGSGAEGFTTASAGLQSSDFAVAVLVHETQAVDSAASPVGTQPNFAIEMKGLFDNLANPVHHTLNRSDGGASPTEQTVLQSLVVRAEGITGGVGTRTAMALSNFNKTNARVNKVSGKTIDAYWMDPLTKQQYKDLLLGVTSGATPRSEARIQTDGSRATTGDGGFTELAHDGVRLRTTQHMPERIVVHESQDCWERTELMPGSFQDKDGAVLSRVANQDAWEGFYAIYLEQVCTRPNGNAIVVGYALN